MKSFALLAAFLALASANSLGFTRQEVRGWSPLTLQWQKSWMQQSPAQEIRQQIQKSLFVNTQQEENSVSAQDAVRSDIARQTDQRVVEQYLLARQRQTVPGIQQVQRQMNVQDASDDTVRMSTTNIRNLRKWLQIQQLVAPLILVNSQLTQTLPSLIQAQLSSETPATSNAIFQARVQELCDISSIKEIETEILNQQACISELQLQHQIVADQIQQTVASQSQDVVELNKQCRRMTVEILARQLVIQQLQQALVDRIPSNAQQMVWTGVRPQTGF